MYPVNELRKKRTHIIMKMTEWQNDQNVLSVKNEPRIEMRNRKGVFRNNGIEL